MLTPTAPRAALLAAALVLTAGCVERKMVVRSDPPGALLTLDGTEVEQRTPVEIPFDWGGTRSVSLAAPGHRVLDTTAKLSEPWFTYFPLDIVAEFVLPFTIHDVQQFDFKLEPYYALDKSFSDEQKAELKRKLGELKLRAEEYRAGGSQGPGRVTPPDAAPQK